MGNDKWAELQFYQVVCGAPFCHRCIALNNESLRAVSCVMALNPATVQAGKRFSGIECESDRESHKCAIELVMD